MRKYAQRKINCKRVIFEAGRIVAILDVEKLKWDTFSYTPRSVLIRDILDTYPDGDMYENSHNVRVYDDGVHVFRGVHYVTKIIVHDSDVVAAYVMDRQRPERMGRWLYVGMNAELKQLLDMYPGVYERVD